MRFMPPAEPGWSARPNSPALLPLEATTSDWALRGRQGKISPFMLRPTSPPGVHLGCSRIHRVVFSLLTVRRLIPNLFTGLQSEPGFGLRPVGQDLGLALEPAKPSNPLIAKNKFSPKMGINIALR